MKHLGIADFLIATEPMQILAIVLGSKLANHGGIVLALFVYVHFVPNLKLGQRYVFLSNHKIRPKVTAYAACTPTAICNRHTRHYNTCAGYDLYGFG